MGSEIKHKRTSSTVSNLSDKSRKIRMKGKCLTIGCPQKGDMNRNGKVEVKNKA